MTILKKILRAAVVNIIISHHILLIYEYCMLHTIFPTYFPISGNQKFP